MKKLLVFTILALMPVVAINAQTDSQPPPRQALRVGMGMNIGADYDSDWENTGNFSLGFAINMDYQYVLTKYIDLNVAFTFSANDYAPQATKNSYSTSLRAMFTPLPNSFRYIQIGAGLAYSYTKIIFEDEWIDPLLSFFFFNRSVLHLFGIDIPIRLYIIDNQKFQLFFDYTINYRMFSYDQNTRLRNHRYLDNIISIGFGVKF